MQMASEANTKQKSPPLGTTGKNRSSYARDNEAANSNKPGEAVYNYRDEKGDLLYQAVRRATKQFCLRRPGSDGGYIWNVRDVRLVPYRLPELLANELTKPVYIVEGEKDVETLVSRGLSATTNAMGAGKWRIDYNQYFARRHVVILPDNDKAGREHAEHVANSLNGTAASVKILFLPGLPAKGDVTDWLQNGGTVDELRQLVKSTQPQEAGQHNTRHGGDTVNEGERHVAATRHIGSRLAKSRRLDEASVARLRQEFENWNNDQVRPPLPEKELQKIFDSILESERANKAEQNKTQATKLIEVVSEAKLFHTHDGEAFAIVPVGSHTETHALDSRSFQLLFQKKYYTKHGGSPNKQALQDATGILKAQAMFDGPEVSVHTRIAEREDKIYLDLGSSNWEVVEIDAAGWRVLADSPVRFHRTKGMLSLPSPQKSGTIGDLRPFLNATGDNWLLIVAWLFGTFNLDGPFPVLVLNGEQGSAKSTTAQVLRSLVDPNAAPLRSDPGDTRDLMISANNAWVVAYDNLSYLPRRVSDALCRVSSGGGFATRELYSNKEEMILDVKRPIMLTGIEELATRGDLLDRALLVDLQPIQPGQRLPESTFWRQFEEVRPRVLGALLDGVSAALKQRRHVDCRELPRLADFATWVTAGESALGWRPGTFMSAYQTNRRDANELALAASPVATALINFMVGNAHWEGTATDLLDKLENRRFGRVVPSWPKSPKGLSDSLRRLSPSLRTNGLSIEFRREPGGVRRRLITISQKKNDASQPSQGRTGR